MKTAFTALILLVLSLFSISNVFASGFYVETIGSMAVGGTAYDHYWYTGANPTISGVAPAGATVTVTVDGTSGTATADASGKWSYPTTMAEGDHTVSMTTASIGGQLGFILTIGATPDGVSAIDTTDTPVAGSIHVTLALLALGIGLLTSPLLLKRLLQA